MDATTFKKPFDVTKIAEDLVEDVKDTIKDRFVPGGAGYDAKALLTERGTTHGSF